MAVSQRLDAWKTKIWGRAFEWADNPEYPGTYSPTLRRKTLTNLCQETDPLIPRHRENHRRTQYSAAEQVSRKLFMSCDPRSSVPAQQSK